MEPKQHLHNLQVKLKDAEQQLKALAQHGKQQLEEQVHKTSTRMKNFPDWGRRSIRLSTCMVLLGLLGHTVHWGSYNSEFRQSFNWATITCIVVTAPLIGQAAEVSAFRVIGTIIGGTIGFMIWSLGDIIMGGFFASILVVCFSPAIVTATTWLAYKHSADQLSKFVQLTYVIVGFNAKPEKSAAIIAFLRVLGIICGGLLSLTLAVLVLPRSATVESCREMKKTIKALAELNKAVWSYSSTPVPLDSRQRHRGGLVTRLTKLPGIGHFFSSTATKNQIRMRDHTNLASASAAAMKHIKQSEQSKREVEVEKLFSTVTNGLSKIETMLGQCRGEVYIHHLWGTYFFLPSWLPPSFYGYQFKQHGKWHLPYEDMSMVLTILRRVSRLLWSLLLDFEDGFDATMQQLLAQYYPKALMSELALYTHKALMDLHDAFPNNTIIMVDNLISLGQLVDCLITISDTRNRSAVFSLRKRQPRDGQFRSGALTSQGSGNAALPEMVQGSSGSMTAYHSILMANVSSSGAKSQAAVLNGHTSGNVRSSFAEDSKPLLPRAVGDEQTSTGSASVQSIGLARLASAGFAVNVAPEQQAASAALASRALSGKPGELSYLDLPPRRLLRAALSRISNDGEGPAITVPPALRASQDGTLLAHKDSGDRLSAGGGGVLNAALPGAPRASPTTSLTPPVDALIHVLSKVEEEPDMEHSAQLSMLRSTRMQHHGQLARSMSPLTLPTIPSEAELSMPSPPQKTSPFHSHSTSPFASQMNLAALAAADNATGLDVSTHSRRSHPSSEERDSAESSTVSDRPEGATWHGQTSPGKDPNCPTEFTFTQATTTTTPSTDHTDEKLSLLSSSTPSGPSASMISKRHQSAFAQPGAAAQLTSSLNASNGAVTGGAGFARQPSGSRLSVDGEVGEDQPLLARSGAVSHLPHDTDTHPSRQSELEEVDALMSSSSISSSPTSRAASLAGTKPRTPRASLTGEARELFIHSREVTSRWNAAGAALQPVSPDVQHGAVQNGAPVDAAHSPEITTKDSNGLAGSPAIRNGVGERRISLDPAGNLILGGSGGGVAGHRLSGIGSGLHRFASGVAGMPSTALPLPAKLQLANQGGVTASALTARLDSMLTAAMVEPIMFPPTEEGYVSQVRWHTLQWLLDELVEELEEAFLGISTIMGKLPHPIK